MSNLSEIIKNKTIVVVDLETTGLDANRDHIIEIGAVKIEKGRMTEKFSTFVSCPVTLPTEITELTGITENDLKGAPSIEEALESLYGFMRGCILVTHNLPFNFAFLRNWGFWCNVGSGDEDDLDEIEAIGVKEFLAECDRKEGFGKFKKEALDTVALSREILKDEVENYRLSTLAKYFGIEFTHHRALNDAETTAKIFWEITKCIV